jgi:hypothetical protein
LVLEGLVLDNDFMPGQYSRVGYFKVTDIWAPQDHERILSIQAQIKDRSQPMAYEDDPYGNGAITKTLVYRYGVEKRYLYPNINSLLTAAYIHSRLKLPDGTLKDDIYDKSHGDGYLTYELV